MSNRKLLRQSIHTKRFQLSIDKRKIASQKVADQLCHHPIFLQSKHIALYLSCEGELDPMPTLISAINQNKHCYLPVLHNKKLRFAKYTPGDKLRQNRYGIPEPHVDVEQTPEQLDLVLTPLVGFDKKGNRLGMGGGYYDRSFEFKLKHPELKPKLFGLAYDFQELPSIIVENWDVPLDYVVTEKQIIQCR